MPIQLGSSQQNQDSSKYLEGLYLSHRVSPDTPTAYSEGMLSVLHNDAKKRIRVKSPRVKGGYYYRMQEVSDRPQPPAAAKKGNFRTRPTTPNMAGIIAGAAIGSAIAGAAIGGGIALWSQQGTKGQVSGAREDVGARVKKEVERVSQDLETKYQQEAEKAQQEANSRLETEVSKVRQETEQRFAGETEEIRKQAVAEVEAVQKRSQAEIERITQEAEQRVQQRTQAEVERIEREATERVTQGIESGVSQERERLGQREQELEQQSQSLQERSKELESTYKERRKMLEKSFADQTTNLEREHQTRVEALEIKAQQLEMSHAARIKSLEESNETVLAERTKQIEARVNTEKLQEIAQSRQQAIDETVARLKAEQQEANDQKLAGTVGRGKLISNGDNGVELAASVRRGLDLNTIGADSLRERIMGAVDKLVSARHAKALEATAPAFVDRMKTIRSMGGRTPQKWQAAEQSMIQQTNRENAIGSSMDEIKEEFRGKHQKALDQFMAKAEGRGSYDEDLITEFDKKLTRLNSEMQKRMNKAVESVMEDIQLDKPFLGRGRDDD